MPVVVVDHLQGGAHHARELERGDPGRQSLRRERMPQRVGAAPRSARLWVDREARELKTPAGRREIISPPGT